MNTHHQNQDHILIDSQDELISPNITIITLLKDLSNGYILLKLIDKSKTEIFYLSGLSENLSDGVQIMLN